MTDQNPMPPAHLIDEARRAVRDAGYALERLAQAQQQAQQQAPEPSIADALAAIGAALPAEELAHVQRVPDTVSAERRIEDALTHYAIGQAAADAPAYVDWQYVAEQMAAALRGKR